MNNILLSGQDIVNLPALLYKKISSQFKVALISTVVIGIVAHLFCYTNIFPFHDNSALYWEPIDFSQAATGSRWMAPFWQAMVGNMLLPWIEGVLTLFFFGVSSWLVCEVLSIHNTVLVCLVSGLLVTSPTTISSNMYLSSAHIYAGALLLAALSVYAFEKAQRGWLWSLLCLVLCAGTYGAYVGFAVSLFLMLQIVRIVSTPCLEEKAVFLHHLLFLVICGASMLLTSVIISVLLRFSNTPTQDRVERAMNGGVQYYLDGVEQAVKDVITCFSPASNLSYFQRNRILYALFVLVAAVTLLLCVYTLVKNQIWKRFVCTLVVLIDLLCLPLAMNLIGIFYPSHTLMRFAYILPWLCFVQIVQILIEDKQWCGRVPQNTKKTVCASIYTFLVLSLSVVTVVSEIYVANAAYAKAYALHESGISLTNRIVDRIEGTPGYVAGETKVFFVGSLWDNYYFREDGYDITNSITGVALNTALTYNLVLTTYIQQHLGIDMDILTTYECVSLDSDLLRNLLDECGVAWANDAAKIVEDLHAYPASDCVYLKDNVLLIRFS